MVNGNRLADIPVPQPDQRELTERNIAIGFMNIHKRLTALERGDGGETPVVVLREIVILDVSLPLAEPARRSIRPLQEQRVFADRTVEAVAAHAGVTIADIT